MTHFCTFNRSVADRIGGLRPLLLLVAATTLALLLGQPAPAAAVRWVNGDANSYAPPGVSCVLAGYKTIQAAVNAASPGDVVKVCPGAYVEHVLINIPNLIVTSTVLPAATVVKTTTHVHVFDITAPGVTLQGFTIAPGGFDKGDIGVNVAINGPTNVKILDNVILGGRIGVNLGCTSYRTIVADNTVNGQSEGGINIDTCETTPVNSLNPGTHHNVIHHNVACGPTSTGSIALGGNSNDNQIYANVATSISVWGHGNSVHDNTTQLVIVPNSPGNTLTNNAADPGVCSITCP